MIRRINRVYSIISVISILDAAFTANYYKWIAGAILFGCGAVIGAALALLSVPSKTAGLLALSAKPVEMVLVVQTATSASAVPVAQPTTEAVAPQPTQLPIVGISETLKGAPDYARISDASAPIQLVMLLTRNVRSAASRRLKPNRS